MGKGGMEAGEVVENQNLTYNGFSAPNTSRSGRDVRGGNVSVFSSSEGAGGNEGTQDAPVRAGGAGGRAGKVSRQYRPREGGDGGRKKGSGGGLDGGKSSEAIGVLLKGGNVEHREREREREREVMTGRRRDLSG